MFSKISGVTNASARIQVIFMKVSEKQRKCRLVLQTIKLFLNYFPCVIKKIFWRLKALINFFFKR